MESKARRARVVGARRDRAIARCDVAIDSRLTTSGRVKPNRDWPASEGPSRGHFIYDTLLRRRWPDEPPSVASGRYLGSDT